jgi:hypothetical protein
MFSDSIENNCEVLDQMIRALPRSQLQKAQKGAEKIEKVFQGIQKDNPGDGAVTLGVAWAIYKIGQKMVEQSKEGKHEGLIQLIR